MRVILLLTCLLVTLNVTLARRDVSLRVFDQVRGQVRSRNIRTSGLTSELFNEFQRHIIILKEKYVESAIDSESGILENVQVKKTNENSACFNYVEGSTDMFMNLAGVAFTNCLNSADSNLYEQVSKIDGNKITHANYDEAALLGSFRGENIFASPKVIESKLSKRIQSGGLALPHINELDMSKIKGELGNIRGSFSKCMEVAKGRLTDSFVNVVAQANTACV